MRIAVTSSDGENVDLHFGKGNSLYVYDYNVKLVREEGTVKEALDSYINHINFMKNVKI